MLAFQASVATPVPPVPGGCSAPALENVGKPGCYLSAQIHLQRAPATIYWHIYTFGDSASARGEAKRHQWSTLAYSHGRTWLYVLGPRRLRLPYGRRMASIGPMQLAPGKPVTARFIESIFPPGMRTRVHSHPGPEGFYVVEGEQCMETPMTRRRVTAGGSFIVPAGDAHVQAAINGRRNIGVVFQPDGTEWMRIEDRWSPSTFCLR